MQRDDEPHILASIEAAARGLEAAETNKRNADREARAAKDDRDRARRLLNDRIIAGAWNQVPQKLIAEKAGRSREAIRLAVLARVDPETVYGTMPAPRDKYGQNWRGAALATWMDVARGAGLEPMTLAGDLRGDQVAWVLVYDTVYLLELNGTHVDCHLDPFADPRADWQTSEPAQSANHKEN